MLVVSEVREREEESRYNLRSDVGEITDNQNSVTGIKEKELR